MTDVVIIAYTGCLLSPHDGHTPIGVKGVGKDTLASIIAQDAANAAYDVVNISFADALKDLVERVYGLKRSVWDCPERKEQDISMYPGFTYRMFLEKVGTDVGRYFNANVWLELTRKRILREMQNPWSVLGVPFDEVNARVKAVGLPELVCRRRLLIQITDVRFKCEYDMLKSLNAKFIQVRRQASVYTATSQHISNQFDPTMVPDVVVDNNKSVLHLMSQASQIFERLTSKS